MNTESTRESVDALLAIALKDESTWPEWMTAEPNFEPAYWDLDCCAEDEATQRLIQLSVLVMMRFQSQQRYITALQEALQAALPPDDRMRRLWLRLCDAYDDLVQDAIEATSKIERGMGDELPLVLRFEPLIEKAMAL